MKNVMKKLAGLLMVLSVALFAGCSDSSDRANEAPQTAKTYTVSGKISIGSAVPAGLAKSIASASEGASSNARTATTSFDMDKITYETKTKWEAEATFVDGDNISENDIHIFGKIDPNEKKYSFNLPQGTWTLMLALEGEYKEKHVDFLFYNEFEKTVDSSNVSENVVLFPRYSLKKNGALNLTITDDTTDHKIKTVTCELNYLNWATMDDEEGQALIEESLNKSVETLKKLVETLKVPQAFSDGKMTIELVSAGSVTIDLEEVPAGSYEATFTFKDSSGNKLYACKENITVFSGWTTDTWLGEGAHLKKNANGEIEFKITEDDLFDVENVPDTQMVLYKAYTDEGETPTAGYKYYLSNSADSALGSEIAKSTLNLNSFIFDNDGYFYALKSSEVVNGTQMSYIFSNKPDFGTDCVKSVSGYSYEVLVADHVTGDLYGIVPSDGTKTFWSSFTNGAKYANTAEELALGRLTDSLYAMNNDILYIFGKSDSEYKLYVIDFKHVNASHEISSVDKTIPIDLSSKGLSSSVKFTDMLYQDGAVYILMRKVSSDFSGVYSTGALLRCDVTFGTIKLLGLSNLTEPVDVSGAKLYSEVNGKQCYIDGALSEPLYVSADFNSICSLYTPAPLRSSITLAEDGFYGPVKFVAVKPKKLVIADDGLAFYTDDDDVLRYKNVSRVVTVDLESFAIDPTETTETSVNFEKNSSDMQKISFANTTEFQDDFGDSCLSSDKKVYYDGKTDGTTYLGDISFGIPCGE